LPAEQPSEVDAAHRAGDHSDRQLGGRQQALRDQIAEHHQQRAGEHRRQQLQVRRPGEPAGDLRRGQRHERHRTGRRGRHRRHRDGQQHQQEPGAAHPYAERLRRVVAHLQHPQPPAERQQRRGEDQHGQAEQVNVRPGAAVERADQPDRRRLGGVQPGAADQVAVQRHQHGADPDADQHDAPDRATAGPGQPVHDQRGQHAADHRGGGRPARPGAERDDRQHRAGRRAGGEADDVRAAQRVAGQALEDRAADREGGAGQRAEGDPGQPQVEQHEPVGAPPAAGEHVHHVLERDPRAHTDDGDRGHHQHGQHQQCGDHGGAHVQAQREAAAAPPRW
jgi:hypothetical protein